MLMNRKLILLWFLCLIFIAYAVAVKTSHILEENPLDQDLIGQNLAENSIIPDSSFYENLPDDNTPSTKTKNQRVSPIQAKSYLVGDVSTGEIYIQKSSDLVLPVASMSKLITAVASIDEYGYSKSVKADDIIFADKDSAGIVPGDEFTVSELLYPLLLNSSNLVAEVLASSTNRVGFMEDMSSYAWEIGMQSTFFADPSGLNPLNISSAKDFFALAKYLYNSRSDILSITRNSEIIIATTTKHGSYTFISTHPFVNYPGFLGGKTGRTNAAKETMLTILTIKDKPIAIIVLGSENRRKDTQYLIELITRVL